MPAAARLQLQRGMTGLMCISHLGLEGCHHFLPVTVPLLLSAFAIDYAQFGLLTLLALSLTTGAQPLFGWLADRWRPERMILLSILWVGLCMSLSGLMPTFGWLSLAVISASLGSAAYHPAAAAVTLRYARVRPGMTFAVFSLGGTLGVALSPLLINYSLPRVGLASTLIYAPFAVLCTALLYAGFRRLRAPLRARPQPQTPRRAQVRGALARTTALLLALLVLSIMTRSWAYGAFMAYLPAWVQATFGTSTLGGELMAAFAILAAVGNLAGGYAADRVAGWKVLTVSFALMAVALWAVLQGPRWALLPLVGLFGLAEGATLSVPMIVARGIIPTRNGLAAALVMGIGWIPAGIGAWVTGNLADAFGLRDALSFLAWAPMLGLLAIAGFALMQARSTLPAARPAAS